MADMIKVTGLDPLDIVKFLKICPKMPDWRKDTIPEISEPMLHVVCRDMVRFTATDMDVRYSMTAKVDGAAASAPLYLPEHTVRPLLVGLMKGSNSRAENGEVKISAAPIGDKGEFMIHLERRGFEVDWPLSKAAQEYPKSVSKIMPQTFEPEPDPGTDVPFDAEAAHWRHVATATAGELRSALGKAQHAISTEETRYYLNGVFVDLQEPHEPKFVSTDGHRLIAVPSGFEIAQLVGGMILPRHSVYLLLAVLATRKVGDVVTWSYRPADRLVRFQVGEHDVMSKVIDGTFPDWRKVVPDPAQAVSHITVEKIRLADAVKAAYLAAPKREQRKSIRIAPEETGSGVIVASDGPTTGARFVRFVETSGEVAAIPNGASGAGLDGRTRLGRFAQKRGVFGVNWQYLTSAMDALAPDETDMVRLSLIDAGSPIRIEPWPPKEADPDGVPEPHIVLMPMRI